MIFRLMRIIFPQNVRLEGLGVVTIWTDFKYGTQWAKRWERP